MAKSQTNGQNGAQDFAAFAPFAPFFDPKQFSNQFGGQFGGDAFTKAFSASGFDFTALAASQQKTLEVWAAAQKTVVEAAQAVGKRQAELTREALDQGSKTFAEIAAAGTPAEKVQVQLSAAKAAYDKGLATAEEFAKISAEANRKASHLIAKRVSESLDEVAHQVETAQETKAAKAA